MSSIAHEVPGVDSLANLLPAFSFDSLIEQDVTGVVFKARHRSLERDVAIRIVPSDAGVDADFRTAFQKDARRMARLAHPNLIRVYDCGDINGHLYSVTEFVAGQSLLRCARGIAVDSEQAVGIIAAACRGLAHAHENGVVHGGITPANILLTAKCEPKIGNFGKPEHHRHEADGMSAVPSAYMAPEMAGGQAGIGPQADVYALGMILRELLTGIAAGSGNPDREIISDRGLDAICRQATHPDPACRFADASSFAGELELWMVSGKSAAATGKKQLVFDRPSAPVRQPLLSCPRPSHASPRPALSTAAVRRSHGGRFIATSCIVAVMALGAGFLAIQPKSTGSQAGQNVPSQANSTKTTTAGNPAGEREAALMRIARSE